MKQLLVIVGLSFLSINAMASRVDLADVEGMLGVYENDRDTSLKYEINWVDGKLSLETNEKLLPECSNEHFGDVKKIDTKFKYLLDRTEYILMYVPIISSCTSWRFQPWLTILYNKETKSLLVKRSAIKGYRKLYDRVTGETL